MTYELGVCAKPFVACDSVFIYEPVEPRFMPTVEILQLVANLTAGDVVRLSVWHSSRL